MRQIAAIVLFYFAAMLGAHAADNNDVQQGIFNSYLKLANEGDVVAQYVVAQRYETGRGTEKDMEKAYYWYEMAAKQQYPLALVKLEARDRAAKLAEASKPAEPAPAPVVAAASKPEPVKKPPVAKTEPPATPKPRPVAKAPAAPAPVASTPKPAEPAPPREEAKPEARPAAPESVVARAAPVEEPAAPSINVMQALLGGKWKRNLEDVEYLPSGRAACLQSGSAEIVCFSEELTRNVDNAGLTYNVKSVITGVNNKEAKFSLRYVYNVVHVANRPHAAPNGMTAEIDDMAVKTGWQEPGVTLECRLRDERSMSCTRLDRRMTYQFGRE